MRSRLAVGRRVGAGLVIAMLAAWAPAGAAHADAPLQRYIVTYRSNGLTPLDAAHTAAASAAQTLPDDGSKIDRTYRTLPAVAVTLTDAARRALAAQPGVLAVTPDIPFHTFEDAPAPPAPVTASSSALPTVTGQGWTVAIVDTGVDTSHPYVAGRTSKGFDGQGDVGACFAGNCPGGGTAEFGEAAAQPCTVGGCDHGTHVAGIALGALNAGGPGGVAPQAGLYPVRVFSTDAGGASADPADVLAALDHIAVESAHYHFASVNLSLGGQAVLPVPCTGVDPAMEAAIQQLDTKGIAVTVASGNHGNPQGISFPACAPGAISVGALDTTGQVASFSDAVSGLSLVAPGTAILSSVPGGGFAQKSGTSMAAPVVAGAFALARQAAPNANLTDLLQLFRTTGTPATDARGGAGNATYPAINTAAALATLGFAPPNLGGGTSFHGLATPQRLVDTRIGGGPLAAGSTLTVTVPNVPITAAGSPAVSLNVTSVGATGPGFLTVFPCGGPLPVVSNVNYVGAAPVANKVVVGVPPNGQVCVFSMTATNVVVDMDGWLEAGHPFNAVTPHRVADTRQAGVRVTDINLPVAPPGSTAAVVNVTITDPVAPGFATLYPCGSSVPLASNLNFRAGDTVPGAALVPVDTGGHVCVHTSTPANVLVDVDGYLTAGFTPIGPSRAVDTRTLSQKVTDVVLSPVGLPGATGFALTLTVTEPTAAGFATVFPCGQAPPLASNINFIGGQTIANAVVATPNPQGQICIHSPVPTHLIVDMSGFFA